MHFKSVNINLLIMSVLTLNRPKLSSYRLQDHKEDKIVRKRLETAFKALKKNKEKFYMLDN